MAERFVQIISNQELGCKDHVDGNTAELEDDAAYMTHGSASILSGARRRGIFTECDTSTFVGRDHVLGQRCHRSPDGLDDKCNYILKRSSAPAQMRLVESAYTGTKYDSVFKPRLSTKIDRISAR